MTRSGERLGGIHTVLVLAVKPGVPSPFASLRRPCKAPAKGYKAPPKQPLRSEAERRTAFRKAVGEGRRPPVSPLSRVFFLGPFLLSAQARLCAGANDEGKAVHATLRACVLGAPGHLGAAGRRALADLSLPDRGARWFCWEDRILGHSIPLLPDQEEQKSPFQLYERHRPT